MKGELKFDARGKGKIISNGILASNPVFRLVLGMCPTLAVTTSAFNGLGMGLAATVVLVCSNVLVSLLRNIIPDKVRIPAFVLIIATFVTIVEMLLRKFVPALYSALGIYLPLIVVNCIILARAEAFASTNRVFDSALDGLFGVAIGNLPDYALGVFLLPAGGFLTLGILMAIINHLSDKAAVKREKRHEEEGKVIDEQLRDIIAEEEKAAVEKTAENAGAQTVPAGEEVTK